MKTGFTTVDEYILTFPVEVQEILRKIQATVINLAPQAVESISYQMPAYKLYGRPLVYFAAFKNHIGFYALPSGHAEFEEALSGYKKGSGSVQFPLDKEMPYDLIKKMVVFRVKENEWFKK